MELLNYILNLVITCMIIVPFIGFAVSISCDIYFKRKAQFMSGMAAGLAKALEETLKKMKEKKNDQD